MKAISSLRHPDPDTATQQPDTQPGNYYVSAMDPGTGNSWPVLGPFPNDHAAALSAVAEATAFCQAHHPRSIWFSFGTVRMDTTYLKPGTANAHLTHLLPVAAAA